MGPDLTAEIRHKEESYAPPCDLKARRGVIWTPLRDYTNGLKTSKNLLSEIRKRSDTRVLRETKKSMVHAKLPTN